MLPKYLTVYNAYLEAHNRILIMKTVAGCTLKGADIWTNVYIFTIDFHNNANIGNFVNFVLIAKNWNVPEIVNLNIIAPQCPGGI